MDKISLNSNIQIKTQGSKVKANPALKPMPYDSVQFGDNTKKQNKNHFPTFLTLSALGGSVATIAFLIYKNRISEAKELTQTLKFQKALTVDEAIEFGKKQLGIKEYIGFDSTSLDAINWFNEGIVNTSNALEGNIRVPKKVQYASSNSNTLAWVFKGGENDGNLGLNKEIFSKIDSKIAERIGGFIEVNLLRFNDGKSSFDKMLDAQELEQLIDKYTLNQLDFNDKVRLTDSLDKAVSFLNHHKESPYFMIEKFYKQVPALEEFFGNLDSIKELPLEQQRQISGAIMNAAKKLGIFSYKIDVAPSSFKTIYHEMGHLQDMQKRPPATDILGFDESRYSDELKNWLNDKWKQQVANSVTSYSTHGPGEFIAEAFANALQGKELSDDVIKLYKELNGPSIPNII